MTSMRSFIDLIEEARPPADLLAEITGLVTALKHHDFHFNTDLVQKTMAAVDAEKAQFDKSVAQDKARMGDEFNPADWKFDRRDIFLDLVSDIVRRSIVSFRVRREANEMQLDYQRSMTTNHDDMNDFVESSDFLSALAAQRDLGVHIDLYARNFSDTATWGPIIAGTKNVLSEMSKFDPNHQQVAPQWMRCVHEDLCQILPLMMFMLRNGLV